MNGKVNGAVETCRGDDKYVMSKTKRLKSYLNFSHPLIAAQHFHPEECAWACGMYIFDLPEWRKTNISNIYNHWLEQREPDEKFGVRQKEPDASKAVVVLSDAWCTGV
ncbi:Probable galacturonosyltransferase 12 [Linum grandiflorum]